MSAGMWALYPENWVWIKGRYRLLLLTHPEPLASHRNRHSREQEANIAAPLKLT